MIVATFRDIQPRNSRNTGRDGELRAGQTRATSKAKVLRGLHHQIEQAGGASWCGWCQVQCDVVGGTASIVAHLPSGRPLILECREPAHALGACWLRAMVS